MEQIAKSPWYWRMPAIASVCVIVLMIGTLNESLFMLLNSILYLPAEAIWLNITLLGDAGVIAVLLLPLIGRRPDIVWAALISGLITAVIVNITKEYFAMPRPPVILDFDRFHQIGNLFSVNSFPSGHTAAAFAVAAVIILSIKSTSIKIAVFLMACLIGLSRVAIGAHWPIDIFAGAIVGWLPAVVGMSLAKKKALQSSFANKFMVVLLTITGIYLIFIHQSGDAEARLLEILIPIVCFIIATPAIHKIITKNKKVYDGKASTKMIIFKNNSWMVLLRVVLSVFILFLIFRTIEIDKLITVFAATQYQYLLLALVFQLLSTLIAGYRWSIVMTIMKFVDDYRFYIKSYFKGSFFNQGLPTSIGGDAIRVLDVAATGHRKRDAFTGVFIDRILGLTGLLLMTLVASLSSPNFLPDSQNLYLLINLIVIAGLCCFILILFFYKLKFFKRWRIGRYLLKISAMLMDVMRGIKNTFVQMSLGVIIHLLSMLNIYCIGLGVGLEYDFVTYLIIVPPALLLTLIPISLAGWGVREGALIFLFTLLGAHNSIILSLSVLYGMILIIASLPGLQVYLVGKKVQKQ